MITRIVDQRKHLFLRFWISSGEKPLSATAEIITKDYNCYGQGAERNDQGLLFMTIWGVKPKESKEVLEY